MPQHNAVTEEWFLRRGDRGVLFLRLTRAHAARYTLFQMRGQYVGQEGAPYQWWTATQWECGRTEEDARNLLLAACYGVQQQAYHWTPADAVPGRAGTAPELLVGHGQLGLHLERYYWKPGHQDWGRMAIRKVTPRTFTVVQSGQYFCLTGPTAMQSFETEMGRYRSYTPARVRFEELEREVLAIDWRVMTRPREGQMPECIHERFLHNSGGSSDKGYVSRVIRRDDGRYVHFTAWGRRGRTYQEKEYEYTELYRAEENHNLKVGEKLSGGYQVTTAGFLGWTSMQATGAAGVAVPLPQAGSWHGGQNPAAAPAQPARRRSNAISPPVAAAPAAAAGPAPGRQLGNIWEDE